jgi:hypothetical protein
MPNASSAPRDKRLRVSQKSADEWPAGWGPEFQSIAATSAASNATLTAITMDLLGSSEPPLNWGRDHHMKMKGITISDHDQPESHFNKYPTNEWVDHPLGYPLAKVVAQRAVSNAMHKPNIANRFSASGV